MDYKLLVIEDEKEIRDILIQYLKKEGYQVAGEGNGIDGLLKFNNFKPHLVILDVMMEGIDGFQVLEQIRLTSEIPVLMLTAKNDEVDRLKGFDFGADDYVTKPFSPREIVKRAISCKAAALIFAHNHPSGETDPSEADKEITKSLITAGTIMEMKVLDHIIIGNNKYFSFADNSLIREYELLARANASRTQNRV